MRSVFALAAVAVSLAACAPATNSAMRSSVVPVANPADVATVTPVASNTQYNVTHDEREAIRACSRAVIVSRNTSPDFSPVMTATAGGRFTLTGTMIDRHRNERVMVECEGEKTGVRFKVTALR